MQTTLYLARHGETQWNKLHRFQGQLDSKLTELGEQQSLQLGVTLSENDIDCIISSPLGRAVATAKICQQELNVETEIEVNLSERDLGQWQGKSVEALSSNAIYSEVLQQFTDIAPAGGESAQACGKRIYQALETIAHNAINKRVLVIFHGEALRCFLLSLGQQHTENAYQLFGNGSVFKLRYQHKKAEFQAVL
ncbi:histidine phosphatase family protein [Thalassotalea profundi]|uniref:Phosphoglycerate mutase GpmB n=1 Tax=Thalassotalea profundi TaxID=2036687 RepID=A0ABQ3IRS0_9GAMM|nr:histidine phosphatase family protein [Thalassotalea profundi]GHE89022.1 putative phosphoglycerate mutase GpmB [Thalassotalea profundi]